MSEKNIRIFEVGPRDGLQNEKVMLSLEDKLEFVRQLSLTGLNKIELGSFVSEKWIPQMKDTGKLVPQILKDQESGLIPKHMEFSVLVPNDKGLERALSSGIKEISIFLSATDSFSKKNINSSMEEAYQIYKKISQRALKEGLKVRAYLSVCFHCPYEGQVSPEQVLKWVKKIEDLGVYEISISDTTGKARPEELENLLNLLFKSMDKNKIACHFHNVHGMALANVWSAYHMGIRSFDGSVGGLGGCPYAKTPSGNVPTEAVLYLLKGGGDPSIKKLIQTALWLEERLKRKLPSPFVHSPYYK